MLKKSIIGLVVVALAGGGYWYYDDYQKKEKARLIKERNELIARDLERMKQENIQEAIKAKERKLKEAEEEKARQERITNGNPIIEEVITYYHGVEQKKAQFTLLEGKLDGIKTMWYPNGHKEIAIHYKDGLKDGLETKWNEKGQKEADIYYKDNLKNGLVIKWSVDGHKSSEAFYVNNKKHGQSTGYCKNGKIWYETHYVDGNQHGSDLHFNCEGTPMKESFYQNGQPEGRYISWSIRTKNLERKEIDGFYKNGKLNGTYNTWYTNGDKREEYHYVDGMLDGDNYSWDTDGEYSTRRGGDAKKIKYHEVYDLNHLLKASSTYPTGEPRFLEEYLPDEDRIKITQWYKDGRVSVEGYKKQINKRKISFVFVDTLRIYRPSGKLTLEIHYNEQGKRDGRCQKWGDSTKGRNSVVVEYDATSTKGWKYDKKEIMGSSSQCQLEGDELIEIYGAQFGRFIPFTHRSNPRG